MKQFWTILKFELSAYFKNKVFVGITIFLVLAVAVLLSFPRVAFLFDKGEEAPKMDQTILVNSDEATFAFLEKGLAAHNIKAEKSTLNESKLKRSVQSEKFSAAIIVTSPTAFTNIIKNVTVYDQTSSTVAGLLEDYYRSSKLIEMGATATDADAIMNINIEPTVIQIGKNQMETFFYTYIMIFALYMAILFYGQLVTTSVATEKSSRAMEVLITSAKPTSLMFGKVFGSGLAGLLQLAVVLGSSFIFFNLNKSFWVENPMINSVFNIPASLMMFMLMFFVLGFFIYAFLYGAIGSLASKLEDINTSVMPITLIFIAAFLVVMTAMTRGDIDSPLMVICSYIPFTSPMAMFTRIAMGNVAAYEIIISSTILVLSTIGIGYIAARIYRIGVLMYGTKPSLSLVIKNLKKS